MAIELEKVRCKKCRRLICRAVYEIIEVVCPKCGRKQTILSEHMSAADAQMALPMRDNFLE
jgi:phage FluMu protein Com